MTPVMYGLFDRRLQTYKKNTRLIFSLDAVEQNSALIDISTIVPMYTYCDICGEEHAVIDMRNVGSFLICNHCYKTKTKICAHCGTLSMYEDSNDKTLMHFVKLGNGSYGYVCWNCERQYKHCAICGDIVHYSQVDVFDDQFVCKKCYNQKMQLYTRCKTCGNTVLKTSIYLGNCPKCNASKNNKIKKIDSYGRTAGKVFFSTRDTGGCYGVELEVSHGNECDQLLSAMSDYQESELKRDGSVPGGFEIVSYPLSLGYHRQYAKWDRMFVLLEEYGYKSHDTSNCGYHIHMSRLSFGDTPRKQSRNIAYLLYLGQKFSEQLKIFSRRVRYDYCQLYNIDYTGTTVTRAYQKAVNYNRHSRYMWLNFQNQATVECRIFRGTLNYTTFIAAIEFLDHLIHICNTCKNEETLRTLTWDNIIESIPCDKSSLKKYLIKKHLMEL